MLSRSCGGSGRCAKLLNSGRERAAKSPVRSRLASGAAQTRGYGYAPGHLRTRTMVVDGSSNYASIDPKEFQLVLRQLLEFQCS